MSGDHNRYQKASVRREGAAVGGGARPAGSAVEYTYVERRVPVELESKAHAAIDAVIRQHGYDPEEI